MLPCSNLTAPHEAPAMPPNLLLRWLLLPACALLLHAPAAAADAKPRRLNIISIVTDDQGRWGVGAYGNRECRTPHMDRLAQGGALFLNAFVPTPVCSPSR